MRCAYQAYKRELQFIEFAHFVGRIRRLRRIRQHKAQFVSNVLPATGGVFSAWNLPVTPK
ncbi:hypothetical protein HTZ85_22700 [Escherichia coli]|nr:hypothetical protein [Escherichia coli]